MSSVMKGLAAKIAEKTKAADTNLQKKLVGTFAQNMRLAAIMEVSGEAWPTINKLDLDPRLRVAMLDELIHATAAFSGRIKQNPAYGEQLAKWEVGFGYWQNFALLDMSGIMPSEEIPPMEIPLSDGTVLVVNSKDSGSVLSKEEHDLRLKLFANVEVIPKGKMVWDWGVSDDRDISEQFALWMQQGPQQGIPAPGQPSMIPTQQLAGSQPKPTRQGGQYSARNPQT